MFILRRNSLIDWQPSSLHDQSFVLNVFTIMFVNSEEVFACLLRSEAWIKTCGSLLGLGTGFLDAGGSPIHKGLILDG